MNDHKYDYETMTSVGRKYGYVIKGNSVAVYVNDELWGSPQGERFIIALLDELAKKEIFYEELLNNWNDKVIDKPM